MLTEQRITLRELLNEHIPRRSNGKPVSPTTVWRWINKGLAGANGERIFLPVEYFGTQPFFTPAGIQSFIEAMTEARRKSAESDAAGSPSQEELECNGLA